MDDYIANAKIAIDRAVQLAPDDPDVISKVGDYYYYAYRDYVRANEQYQLLAKQRPNDAAVLRVAGSHPAPSGRWAESLVNIRRATELDVANASYLSNLIASEGAARRFDEVASSWRRMASLKPDQLSPGYYAAEAAFHASGSTKEVDEYLSNLTPEEASSPEGLSIREDWAAASGNAAEWERLIKIQPFDVNSALQGWEQNIIAARTLFLLGDRPAALSRLGNIPSELSKRLEREPKNPRMWLLQASVALVQGRPADAVSAVDRCLGLIPESLDALEAPTYASLSVVIYDYAGERDRALSEYARLLRDPGSILTCTRSGGIPSPNSAVTPASRPSSTIRRTTRRCSEALVPDSCYNRP